MKSIFKFFPLKRLALACLISFVTVSVADETTVWARIKDNPQTSVFAGYIAELGLSDALDGGDLIIPWTVFVPENSAFAKLPEVIQNKIRLDGQFRRKLITSHLILGASVSVDGIGGGNTLITASGDVVDLIQKDQLYVKDVVVTKKDIIGSNGVIHIVECVMYVQPSKSDDRLDANIQSTFASTACCLADSLSDLHHAALTENH